LNAQVRRSISESIVHQQIADHLWVRSRLGPSVKGLAMTLIIPETFAQIASHVERQYRDDETFRETYDDYLTYCEAYLFWARSRSEEAPTRQREYADLVRELEDELLQILKSPSSSQSLA